MTRAEEVPDQVLDAAMAGARVIATVIARSLAQTDGRITLPQLRVLAVTKDRGSLTLGEVADLLQVHPSNATRLVERLVTDGWVDRRPDPQDRRQLRLTLTARGARVVDQLMAHRRSALAELLAVIPARRRQDLARGLRALAEAGEASSLPTADPETWAVPLSTGRT